MDSFVSILAIINRWTGALFGAISGLLENTPGWISLTVLSALSGAGMALVFRYTVNRHAFRTVLDGIQAELLSVYLFRHDLGVTLRSEKCLIFGAFRLLYHSLLPLLLMGFPLSLLLAQMAAWYQARPFQPGSEPAIVQVKLPDTSQEIPAINLAEQTDIRVLNGPVSLVSRKEVYWEILALRKGLYRLTFLTGGRPMQKTLMAGDGYLPVSPLRPGPEPGDMILYPLEEPFPSGSPIRSIRIDYPSRDSYFSGTGWWLFSFLWISLVAAILVKPLPPPGR